MHIAQPTPTIEAPASIANLPVGGLWDRLAQPTRSASTFDPSMVASLPEPARRWLSHAITLGSPLYRAVGLTMEGHIRLGRWLPFQAMQIQAPPDGYVWTARTRLGPLPISGYDRYGEATGEMHWRLLGHIPVMSAGGADVDRSAAGRVALDALFVPTAWLGPSVTWHDGHDENTAVGEWTIGAYNSYVEITVDSEGRLLSATMPRWGNPNGKRWGEYPCGGMLEAETDFGGIKISTQMRAGWFFGTDGWGQGEFFRASVINATFV